MSWRRFFRRKRADADLEQEIDFYLAEEIDENLARGMSAEQARRQAWLKFGNPQQVRESIVAAKHIQSDRQRLARFEICRADIDESRRDLRWLRCW